MKNNRHFKWMPAYFLAITLTMKLVFGFPVLAKAFDETKATDIPVKQNKTEGKYDITKTEDYFLSEGYGNTEGGIDYIRDLSKLHFLNSTYNQFRVVQISDKNEIHTILDWRDCGSSLENDQVDTEGILYFQMQNVNKIDATLKQMSSLVQFVFDKTMPEIISWEMSGKANEKGWYHDEDLKIQVSAHDANGVANVFYCVDEKTKDSDIQTALSMNGNYLIPCVEGNHFYTIWAVDRAGNKCNEIITDKIKYDNSSPELSVSFSPEEDGKYYENEAIYYKNDISPSFYLKEENFYDEKKELNGTYEYSVQTGKSGEYKNGNGSWKPYPAATFSAKPLTANQETNPIERYVLKFFYEDCADNQMTAGSNLIGGTIENGIFTSVDLIVDKEIPVICNIHFYNNSKNQEITNQKGPVFLTNSENDDFVMTFSIVETYLEKESVNVTAINQETNAEKGFTLDSGEGKLKNTKDNDFIFSFDEEGPWIFKISAQDKAGNHAKLDETNGTAVLEKEVILDHTAPVLEVTYGDAWTNVTDKDAKDIEGKNIKDSTVECFIRESTNVTFSLQEKNFENEENMDENIAEIKNPLFVVNYKADDHAVSDVTTYDLKQKDWKKEKNGTYTYKFPIDQEGHYTFTLTYADPAGNRMEPQSLNRKMEKGETANCMTVGTYTSPVITVDMTDPVIEVSFNQKPENIQDGRNYYQKSTDITITITEENFRAEEFDLDYCTYFYQKDSSKSAVKYYDDNRIGKSRTGWSSSWRMDEKGNEKQVWTTVISWKEEGNCNLSYFYEDLAKRTGKESDKITIDRKKPKIVIGKAEGTKLSDMIFAKNKSGSKLLDFMPYTHYSYFGQDKIFALITAHDEISGVKSIGYQIIDENGQIIKKDVLKNESDDLGKWTGKAIILDENFKGRIQAYAVDRSMNEGNLMQPKGVVSETEEMHKKTSKVKITTITRPSRTIGNIHYYNQPVQINLSIYDSQSGIRAYRYKAGTSIEIRHGDKENPGSDDKEENESKNQYVLEQTLTIPANDVNHTNKDAPTKVELSYMDNAGYTEKAEEQYVIDSKKPEIKVSWTSSAPVQNEKYYNQIRIAHITVIERNFDENGVKWDSFGENGIKGVVISEWSHNGDSHEATVSYTEDGDFDLKFTITDYAVNTAVWDKTDTFTIDKTAPVLSIRFDNNDVANGKYYKSPRTATLSILEHNFRESDVVYQMTASNDGQKMKNPSVSQWKKDGDAYKATIYYGSDGDYTLRFHYTDLAGNKAQEVKAADFTIDRTGPKCEITNIEDHSANNDIVAPGIRFSDTNLEQYTVSLEGKKNGIVTYDREAPISIHNGKTQQWKDFRRKEEVDDIYTMELIATDKAGNQTKVSKMFSVNRFGSNYMFGVKTQELLDQYYSNRETELDVTEVNVNPLKKKEITVRDENHANKILQEGIDYTVKESRNQYGWFQYHYQVNAEVFEEENRYTVTFYSEDQAANKMTNEIKNKTIEFVIDKTAPTGVISGLEETGYREEEHRIYIRAMDNYCLDQAYLMVDGRKYKTMTAADFDHQDDETVGVSLPAKSAKQTIGLIVIDKAGNIGIMENMDCVISPDFWVQISNHNLFYFVLSGIGGTIIAGLFLFRVLQRKKRNQNEKSG